MPMSSRSTLSAMAGSTDFMAWAPTPQTATFRADDVFGLTTCPL